MIAANEDYRPNLIPFIDIGRPTGVVRAGGSAIALSDAVSGVFTP